MEGFSDNSKELILWLGVLVVWMAAMSRFNRPQTLFHSSSEQKINLLKLLKQSFSRGPSVQGLLLRPPRASTTIFRYRLYQTIYAILAILIYFLMLLQPDIQDQFQQIIGWFVKSGVPDITDSGPLVMATFVVLVLPNIPPFRWADIAIRSLLYERALIPAQQLREINRIKMAAYSPPEALMQKVQQLAKAEYFNVEDIEYNPVQPTAKSLWCKCLLLIEHIKIWEVDDNYMTAFAVLKEPDSERRSVDVVKEMQKNLIGDARAYFRELRDDPDVTSRRMADREVVFRNNCRELLNKTYALLAGVTLHSHYSDNERVKQFGDVGLKLETNSTAPLPDSNDMLMLTLILCTVLVFPLAYKLGLVKAVMIGAIMMSAVLSPVFLARYCPGVSDHKRKRYGPNVIYPLLSGLLAASLGFTIFSLAGLFIEPSDFCEYTGYERYLNCSYPWGILHATIALLLATRLPRGSYPDIKQLQGWRRYQQWGNFNDAVICAIGMWLVTTLAVVPLLEAIRPERFLESGSWMIPARIALVSFILGFVVPTWYRAQKSTFNGQDRRRNLFKREQFDRDLMSIRRGDLTQS